MEWLLSRQERAEGFLRPPESWLLTLANRVCLRSEDPFLLETRAGGEGGHCQAGWAEFWPQEHFQALLSLFWSNPSSRGLWPRSCCLKEGSPGVVAWGSKSGEPQAGPPSTS